MAPGMVLVPPTETSAVRIGEDNGGAYTSIPWTGGVEMPEVLDTPAFRVAWQAWRAYRREVKNR